MYTAYSIDIAFAYVNLMLLFHILTLLLQRFVWQINMIRPARFLWQINMIINVSFKCYGILINDDVYLLSVGQPEAAEIDWTFSLKVLCYTGIGLSV